MFKGDVKILRAQIGTKGAIPIGLLATIKSKEVDGEIKEYQVLNSRHTLPGYAVKEFKLRSYTEKDYDIISAILKGENGDDARKKVKAHQRFVANVLDPEYGVKEFFGNSVGSLRPYNNKENIVSGDTPLVIASEDDGPDYL